MAGFHRLPQGQVIRDTSEGDRQSYVHLRALHETMVDASGEMWNWPAAATLTQPSIARILHLFDIYSRVLSVPGVICEFGSHWGAGTSVLRVLHKILEPNNRSRELHVFDTWDGFVGVGAADRNSVDGDFPVSVGWDQKLAQILTLQDAVGSAAKPPEFVLHKGGARESVQRFLESRPEAIVSLAILDMDLDAPTRVVLDAIQDRLVVGSVVVLDELNCPLYPGESVAFRSSPFRFSRLVKSPYLPYAAYTVVEGS